MTEWRLTKSEPLIRCFVTDHTRGLKVCYVCRRTSCLCLAYFPHSIPLPHNEQSFFKQFTHFFIYFSNFSIRSLRMLEYCLLFILSSLSAAIVAGDLTGVNSPKIFEKQVEG